MQRGNVTTYEWVHGEPPLTIEEPKLDFGDDENNETDNDATANVEIDFELDFSAPVDLSGVELEAPVEIDWGDLEVVGDDEVNGNVAEDIDWDLVNVVSEVKVIYFRMVSF